MDDKDPDVLEEIALIVLSCLAAVVLGLILFAAVTANAAQTISECQENNRLQVKELMDLPNQKVQIEIMRRERICKQQDSSFTCYTKLLTKLNKMCKQGELKEE